MQTCQFACKSFFQMIERQESHLIHKPSVRTRRSSMGVELSIRFLSRLNQAMLVVDSPLREDSFRVRMLDLAHFGDEIGQLDELRMRVASGADHVHALGPRRPALRRLSPHPTFYTLIT